MSTDFVSTRASLLKKKPQTNYQEVTYVAYKSKKKNSQEKPAEESEKASDNEFNIRKAKHEIVRFGMSGFDPVRKEEAKIQQLIKLGMYFVISLICFISCNFVGAKPPKNKAKNYKQLLNEKKIAKAKQEKEQKFQQLGKNSVGKATAKGKSFDRKRRKEGILDIYGKILRAEKNK